MHPDVHRYLDGELPRTDLSPEAAADLAAWEEVAAPVAECGRVQAPPWLADEVMRTLPVAPRPLWSRAWDWLMTPRQVRMRPLVPLAAAAGLVLVLLALRGDAVVPPVMDAVRAEADAAPRIYVQFTLTAPEAQSVAVAGDFNDWSADAGVLRDREGNGVWTGLIVVRPGVHKYMFIVNGTKWVTDPGASHHVSDGFGMRNALVAVDAPATS